MAHARIGTPVCIVSFPVQDTLSNITTIILLASQSIRAGASIIAIANSIPTNGGATPTGADSATRPSNRDASSYSAFGFTMRPRTKRAATEAPIIKTSPI